MNPIPQNAKLSDFTASEQKRLKRLARLLLMDCVMCGAIKGVSGRDGERLNALGCKTQIEYVREEGCVITRMDMDEGRPYTREQFEAACRTAGLLKAPSVGRGSKTS